MKIIILFQIHYTQNKTVNDEYDFKMIFISNFLRSRTALRDLFQVQTNILMREKVVSLVFSLFNCLIVQMFAVKTL